MIRYLGPASVLGICLLIAGCASSEPESETAKSTGGTSGADFLATTEPANPMGVGEARKTVEDSDPVTLVGVIGGSREPFVDGLAAFTIVDPSVPYCATEEGCPTPWDYCCTQDQVKDNIATIKMVDGSGSPVSSGARELLGVKELDTVVVEGTAQRDDQGNLRVAATRIFVRP